MTTAAICATREISWNSSLYRGEQYDTDLGLYYLRARYYNPATGRFMSRDPLDGNAFDPKTLHKYLYVGGDPVNWIDPSGRGELFETALVQGGSALTPFETYVAEHSVGIAIANCYIGIAISLGDFIANHGHWGALGYAGGGQALWGCLSMGAA
jgi:RHS repeat-associated protein